MVLPRKRVKLIVELDLDPVPGTFSTKESVQQHVELMLMRTVPWYNPEVTIEE